MERYNIAVFGFGGRFINLLKELHNILMSKYGKKVTRRLFE